MQLVAKFIKIVNSIVIGVSGGLILPISLGFLLLPTALRNPSFVSIGLCIAGCVSSMLIFTAVVFYDDYKQKKGLISGYLSKFSLCSFQRFDIRDFAESKVAESEELNTVPYPFIKIYKNPRDIRIYVVKRGRSPVLPIQFVAYESYHHTAPSYIFCRDEPEKITTLGRFFVYHEFGHAIWRQTDVRLVSRFGWIGFFLPVFWVIGYLQYNTFSLLLLALYILLIVVTYPIYTYLLQELHLYEEVNADRFALNLLSDKSREILADYLIKVEQLPNDPSLSKAQNQKRYWLLFQEIAQNERNYANTNKYPIGLAYLQLIFAVMIVILGFHIRELETSVLMCCPGILLFVGALLLVVGIDLRRDILIEKIEKYFSEKE